MIITYEIEKTVTSRTASLKTLTETTHTDVIKYIDADGKTVFDDFVNMADSYDYTSGWQVDEYDTDDGIPSFTAHKETETQRTKVEIYMRSAMYYENDYEGMM